MIDSLLNSLSRQTHSGDLSGAEGTVHQLSTVASELKGLAPIQEQYAANVYVAQALESLAGSAQNGEAIKLSHWAAEFYVNAAGIRADPRLTFDALSSAAQIIQKEFGVVRDGYQLSGPEDGLIQLEPIYADLVESSGQIYGPNGLPHGVISLDLAHIYQSTGRPNLSVPLYEDALSIFLENWKTGTLADPQLNDALGEYAWDAELALYDSLMTQGAEEKAATSLQEFSGAVRERGDAASGADALNRLGMHYFHSADQNTAIHYYEVALAQASAIVPGVPQLVAVIYDNLASSYLLKGDLTHAEIANKKAIGILQGLLTANPDDPYFQEDLQKSRNNLAAVLSAQGHYQAAFDIFSEIRLEKQKVETGVCVGCGIQDFNIATLMLRWAENGGGQEKLDKALLFSKESVEVNIEGVGPLLLQTADAYSLLADVYQQRGDEANALVSGNKAIAVYLNVARISGAGREFIASHLVHDASRKLDLLFSEGAGADFDDAFATSQLISWSSAAEAAELFSQRLLSSNHETAQILRRRQDAAGELTRLLAGLNNAVTGGSDDQIAQLRSALAQTESEIRGLDGRLEAVSPSYHDALAPSLVSVSDLVAELGDNDVLVQFTMTEPNTYAWVFTKNGQPRWYRVAASSTVLAEEVKRVRCGLDPQEWEGLGSMCASLGLSRSGQLPFDLSLAHDLFRQLFQDLDLAGKHLIVIPSAALTGLPFYSLVTQPSDARWLTAESAKEPRWLVLDTAVSIIPSAASLRLMKAWGNSSGAYLGVAAPKLVGENCPASHVEVSSCQDVIGRSADGTRGPFRIARGVSSDLVKVFADGSDPATVSAAVRLSACPMPETEIEVRCAAESVHPRASKILLGDSATEEHLKAMSDSGELLNYNVLHFATHALVAGQVSEFTKRHAEPALVLTPPESPKSGGDDGLLTSTEIAQLNLNAEWVVLSACSTAAGDDVGAEALSGLARAFIYAGSHALIVSHWPVFTDVAVLVTSQTFANLANSPQIGRAEALRRAIVAMMLSQSDDQNYHPSVWAPLFLVGY